MLKITNAWKIAGISKEYACFFTAFPPTAEIIVRQGRIGNYGTFWLTFLPNPFRRPPKKQFIPFQGVFLYIIPLWATFGGVKLFKLRIDF